MSTIWFVEHTYRDNDNRDAWARSEDDIYYTSKEAAQTKADAMNKQELEWVAAHPSSFPPTKHSICDAELRG